MSDRLIKPLRLAVVGHTNTGKTSLMRTLLRDVDFGEVADAPATTREVSGAAIVIDGASLIHLYDTPGLEDPIGVLDALESRGGGLRLDGPALVREFLGGDAARTRFAPEAAAIRQVLDTDAALYVIDARDRVLEKHRDELRILGYCARPIVPVLNFVASEHARTAEWREQLARVNMHAVAEFDTVVLEAEGEIQLLEKIGSLLDPFRAVIERIIAQRRRERAEVIRASAALIADLLIDAAAWSIPVDAVDEAAMQRAVDDLRRVVREREQECSRTLLELHRFRESDLLASPLPIDEGRWGTDLFSPEALQEYGIHGGGGAATGAMIGLTFDVLTHGLSFGAGTAIGAALGAAIGAGRKPGRHLLERLRGRVQLRIESTTLQVLATRQIDLVHALLHRGHAGRTPIDLSQREKHQPLAAGMREVQAALRKAAGRRAWSRLGGDTTPHFELGRARVVENLTTALTTLISDLDRRRP